MYLRFKTFVIKVPDYGSDKSKHAARFWMALKGYIWQHASFVFGYKILKFVACKFSDTEILIFR